MKKAVLFDLDGTLWDSSLEVAISWSMALELHGIRLTQADVQGVMGKTLEEIAAILLPEHSPEARREIVAECSAVELDYLRIHGAATYAGLEDMLEDLSRDHTLCIVSNCQEGYIETFLEYTGLGRWFTDTENAGRTGRPKDENIALVLERNGLSPALYVGDTQKDLDAAVAAGIPFVHAAYGFGQVDDSFPAIHSLSELPTLARRMLP